MRRNIISLSISLGILLLPVSASAHVVVSPSMVKTGETQTFTVGVPTEKAVPTTAVRLVLPSTIESVTPTVKPGWQIEMKKTTKVAINPVTEIIWSGGLIPPEQRDEFSFEAHAPAKPEKLVWKVYQTFQDGSVISWDQAGEQESNSGNSGPYATTAVVNDLTATANDQATKTSAKGAYVLAGVAMIVSLAALVYKRQ